MWVWVQVLRRAGLAFTKLGMTAEEKRTYLEPVTTYASEESAHDALTCSDMHVCTAQLASTRCHRRGRRRGRHPTPRPAHKGMQARQITTLRHLWTPTPWTAIGHGSHRKTSESHQRLH